jgi:hypothetical protein
MTPTGEAARRVTLLDIASARHTDTVNRRRSLRFRTVHIATGEKPSKDAELRHLSTVVDGK